MYQCNLTPQLAKPDRMKNRNTQQKRFKIILANIDRLSRLKNRKRSFFLKKMKIFEQAKSLISLQEIFIKTDYVLYSPKISTNIPCVFDPILLNQKSAKRSEK